jgi:hypothetical protein
VASAPTKVIRITLGSRQAKIDNARVDMGIAAVEEHGTTYVPLRFIADALGAQASYDRQGGRVEIISSLFGRAAAMSQAGPGGQTTVTGVVSAIDTNSAPPSVTVVRGTNERTVAIDAGIKTTIQDVTTHTTMSGTLASIHVGDSVSLTMTKDNAVVEILDLYASHAGTIVAVSPTAIVLADGRVVTPTRVTTVTLNNDPVQLSDLSSGDAVIIRSNPETGEAREVIASRAVASSPVPGGSGSTPGVRCGAEKAAT